MLLGNEAAMVNQKSHAFTEITTRQKKCNNNKKQRKKGRSTVYYQGAVLAPTCRNARAPKGTTINVSVVTQVSEHGMHEERKSLHNDSDGNATT